jgi:DNA-binding NarL/FixJ family response regulator
MAASQAIIEAIGTAGGQSAGDAAEYAHTRAVIARSLAPESLAVAEHEGRTLTADEIFARFDEAITPGSEAGAALAEPAAAEPAAKEGLTARETEVLRLIANGLSYGQIAERLVISSRTVDAHLRSIYSKLQVRSRHEAARYAFEHNLFEPTGNR